jgi:hypothetical protein
MKKYTPTKCAGVFGKKCKMQAQKKYGFVHPGKKGIHGRHYCKNCYYELKEFYKNNER